MPPTAHILIGPDLLEEGSEGSIDHVNPSTGEVQGTVALAGEAEVDAAVNAAHAAFEKWRRWAPADRRDVLLRLADLLAERADDFLLLQAQESGIPVGSGGLLPGALEWIRHSASATSWLGGQVVPTELDKAFDCTLIEPIGVVGVIIPWNGPVGSLGMCVAPPLAAGCCVLLKPSEFAPFTSSLFGQLCLEAGLPEGVVNVLPGSGATGAALVSHPGVAKISFTGGGATGRAIAAKCGENGKPVLLELGGKSAQLVFEDADVQRAAREAARKLIRQSGQTCNLPSRLLVHQSIHDEYLESLTSEFARCRIGDATDANTHMGPLITEDACTRVVGAIQRAADSECGPPLVGGRRLQRKGFFVEPTVFTGVANTSELAQTEVFGPVLSVTVFRDEEEGIGLANDSRYGLSAYLHTRDVTRAIRVASALDVGGVTVNSDGAIAAMPGVPFGGVKESGYGRVGGADGLREFTRVKNFLVAL